MESPKLFFSVLTHQGNSSHFVAFMGVPVLI